MPQFLIINCDVFVTFQWRFCVNYIVWFENSCLEKKKIEKNTHNRRVLRQTKKLNFINEQKYILFIIQLTYEIRNKVFYSIILVLSKMTT